MRAVSSASPSPTSTKWLSLSAAILNCLAAGSVSVFALYAPQLQRHLNYSSLQVNAIGIACQLGLYLTVPILGLACDNKGPRIVALYAALIALPAYYIASLAYSGAWRPWVLVTCYAVLGSATVALYLSGLSTVAKNYPNSRGLAMAVVTSSFGLSSLWETQVVDKLYRDEEGEIKIRAMYISFGILLSLVGFFSALTLRIVEPAVVHHMDRESTITDQSEQEESDQEDDEYTALLSQSAMLEPSDKLNLTARVKVFLYDHSSWLYFLASVTHLLDEFKLIYVASSY